MRITVNGTDREVPDAATVSGVLAALDLPARGVAVAVDGEIVPRVAHGSRVVPPGAVLEVLTAVQGG